jgi:hypothetical protein
MSQPSFSRRAAAFAKRPVRMLAARVTAHIRAGLRDDLDEVAARVHTDTLVTSEFYALIDRRLQLIERALDELAHNTEHGQEHNDPATPSVPVTDVHQESAQREAG